MKLGIKTRNWSTSEGYRYLAPWSNAVLLRFLIRKFTEILPRSEHRAKAQVDDAARSTVANIEEGWKRPKRKAYLEFLGFSQASLEEVKGDIRRFHQDGFLKSKKNSTLADLGINLKEFKGLLEEDKGNTLLELLYPPLSVFSHNPSPASNPNPNPNPNSSSPPNSSSNSSSNSPPLSVFSHNSSPASNPNPNPNPNPSSSLNSSPNSSSNSSPHVSLIKDKLTFEVFMELVNKTDYLLRQLVTSLERTYSKEDAMSPMQRWQWQEMENQHQQEKNLDEKTKEEMRQQGKIFTGRGYRDTNEAARLGLKEI